MPGEVSIDFYFGAVVVFYGGFFEDFIEAGVDGVTVYDGFGFVPHFVGSGGFEAYEF